MLLLSGYYSKRSLKKKLSKDLLTNSNAFCFFSSIASLVATSTDSEFELPETSLFIRIVHLASTLIENFEEFLFQKKLLKFV